MAVSEQAFSGLITFQNTEGYKSRGTILKLRDTSVVFEVYNPDSIFQLSEILNEIKIYKHELPVYCGRGVICNVVNAGLLSIVSVTLVDEWSGLLVNDSHFDIGKEAGDFVEHWGERWRIRDGYRLAVSNLRAFLSDYSRWLEQVDAVFSSKINSRNDSYQALSALEKPSFDKFTELFGRFEREASQLTEDEHVTHKTFAQKELHPYMLGSPFIHRAYYKPLGYAGDYMMVNMMMDNEGAGPTVYAKLMDAYYLAIGPSQAHRNRIEIISQELNSLAVKGANEDRVVRVFNAGCGPAREIQKFVEKPISERFRLTLLDFNDETIDYAKRKIAESSMVHGNRVSVDYVVRSVHSLLRKNTPIEELDKYDMVYCAGLFDYLSDKVCTRLLEVFYSMVRPGGKVMVTNVHPSNPGRWSMEHLAEWYLIYRDESEMHQLAPNRGVSKVYTDDTGVNVFLEIYKEILDDE